LVGTGLGTFADVYPLYRGGIDSTGLVWDKAHNDHLELLLGLGIPAAGAIFLAIAILALRCLSGVFARRRNSHYPITGFIASVLVGLHAFFDFSLQIQAVAMSFALLLALGVAQSVSDRT
jgi:O-antigen ligase